MAVDPVLITTGEAAALLGVSPRTVARMVDRGELRGYRIGAHRRVDRSSLPRAARHSRTKLAERYLGILLAASVIEHPDRARQVALANLDRQQREPTQSPTWTERWADLVDRADFATIIEVLSDPDDRTGLRQTHPFRGLVSPEQRRAALTLAEPETRT